jgi:uncharacterized metal-binding protein
MASGLPVLYRKGGGSINEYCLGHGEEYQSMNDMLQKINKILSSKMKVCSYDRKIESVIAQYEEIIRRSQ